MNPPIIVERDSALPLTHLTLAFDQGSLFDPPNKEGTSSLLFRLMRRTVAGMSALEVENLLDSLGASAGVEVARSVAVFQGSCLSRSWRPFTDLVSQMLSSAPENEDEFRRLKAEAISEWVDSLDNDALIARRVFVKNIFPGHPYGRLSTGTPHSIERIELEDLSELYQRIVVRERLLGSFSGDVSRENCESFLSGLSSCLTQSGSAESISVADALIPSGRRLFFVDKPERSQVQILIGGLGAHPKDNDRAALYVGNTIFGGTFSARLSREVRGKRGWSYGAYSQLAHDRSRQSFSMWTFPQASDAVACIELQLKLLAQFIESGVSKAELSAAKKYLLNSHAFTLDTASKRAALALDQRIYDLPPLETFKERVLAVTLEDVNNALKNRLSAKDIAIVVLGTADPLLSELKASLGELSQLEVVPFDLRD